MGAEVGLAEILAGLAGLAGLAALFNSFSKASSSRVDALCKIIDRQQEHIATLEAQLTAVRRELNRARRRYNLLLAWIRERGLEPPEEVSESLHN